MVYEYVFFGRSRFGTPIICDAKICTGSVLHLMIIPIDHLSSKVSKSPY